MRERQLPFDASAMPGALREDFRREHARDLEQLEFHRIAAAIGRSVHKCERAGKIAGVIAGCFRNEKRRVHTNPHNGLNGF